MNPLIRLNTTWDRLKWRSQYRDTHGYFYQSELRIALEEWLPTSGFSDVLEIGSYEGVFACYAAKNFAKRVETVDPFEIGDPGTSMHKGVEKNFWRNVNAQRLNGRVVQHKMTSSTFFTGNERMFDFIYVDGSHEPEQAIRDLDAASNILRPTGVLWIDDYGSEYKGLNAVLGQWRLVNSDRFKLLHEGYQLGLQKT